MYCLHASDAALCISEPLLLTLRLQAFPGQTRRQPHPASFAGLRCLRSVVLGRYNEWEDVLADDRELPVGPWMHSVLNLSAPLPVLLNSTHVLRRTRSLQSLLISDAPDLIEEKPDAWRAFWRWAAEHGTLEQLTLRYIEDEAPARAAVAELLRLQHERPALAVDVGVPEDMAP